MDDAAHVTLLRRNRQGWILPDKDGARVRCSLHRDATDSWLAPCSLRIQ